MKCFVIIGSHNRNLSLLKKLITIKNIEISHVFILKRENLLPEPQSNLDSEIKKLWKLHFKKRMIAENKFFNFNNEFLTKIKNVSYISSLGELNSSNNLNIISSLKKYCCFISGIPIIREPLLSYLPVNTVNLHLGLIPFYKGSITTFWPFYNLEPDMLGTTYHIIDKYVDTGEILHQNKPQLKYNDTLHSSSCKAVISAIEDLQLVVNELIYRNKNNIKPKKDDKLKNKGRLYLKKDWKPSMLKKIYVDYNDKIVDYYLKNKIDSQKKIKLIKLMSR